MRLPQLSAGVVRDRFTVIGRGLGGIAPRQALLVCGDPCTGEDVASIPCPEECPCTYMNGSTTCYKSG